MGQSGKGNKGGKKGGGYVHKVTINPKARDSDDRRVNIIINMAIKRCQRKVDHITNNMKSYVPPHILQQQKKRKIDPLYDLKGAARPAAEHYKDPNMIADIGPIDVFELYKGRLWEHEEGKNLLKAMLQLSVEMHNSGLKSKDAIKTLNSMLELDKNDTIRARHHLLRVYLDMADAENARNLLDRYKDDKHCCFVYTRALIEHISLLLKEEGSSKDLRDEKLLEAYEVNPYGIFLLAYGNYFKEALDHVDTNCKTAVGSIGKYTYSLYFHCNFYHFNIEDAIAFFSLEMPLWEDTDEILDSIRELIETKNLQVPNVKVNDDNNNDNVDNNDDSVDANDNNNDGDHALEETNTKANDDNDNNDDNDDFNPEAEIDPTLSRYYHEVFNYVMNELEELDDEDKIKVDI